MLARKARKGHRDPAVQQEVMARQGLKDHKDLRASLDLPVTLG